MGWSINRQTGLTYHRPQRSTKGYTLVTPGGGDSTLLLDMAGRIVHRWVYTDLRPSYARLLSSGHLLVRGTDRSIQPQPPRKPKDPPPPLQQRVRALGGNCTQLREVDWDGKTVWEHVDEFMHHDFVRLPNGNTLYPAWVELPAELAKQVRGGQRRRGEKLPPMLGDDLVEVGDDGQELRRIHTWKLLDPRRDPIGPIEHRWEWTHLNGIDVNEAGDIGFSCRNNSRLGIIDAKSGELRWKYGDPDTHWQHHPSWVDGGNVQVFDNGRMGSRVIEVDPATDKVVWSYASQPAQQFYSGHISGAHRLPTGAVLVCEGASGRLFEVTRDGEVVWEWINPFVNTDPRGRPVVAMFRAHRYLPDHPGLRERSLDPEAWAELNRLNGLGPV
jgi:outer membrane protein assembly factor BamB